MSDLGAVLLSIAGLLALGAVGMYVSAGRLLREPKSRGKVSEILSNRSRGED